MLKHALALEPLPISFVSLSATASDSITLCDCQEGVVLLPDSEEALVEVSIVGADGSVVFVIVVVVVDCGVCGAKDGIATAASGFNPADEIAVDVDWGSGGDDERESEWMVEIGHVFFDFRGGDGWGQGGVDKGGEVILGGWEEGVVDLQWERGRVRWSKSF